MGDDGRLGPLGVRIDLSIIQICNYFTSGRLNVFRWKAESCVYNYMNDEASSVFFCISEEGVLSFLMQA